MDVSKDKLEDSDSQGQEISLHSEDEGGVASHASRASSSSDKQTEISRISADQASGNNRDNDDIEGNKGVWTWFTSAVENIESTIESGATNIVKSAKANLTSVKGSAVEGAQAFGRNVVEKTKKSVDMVISTLDPGMAAEKDVDNLPIDVIVSARKKYIIPPVKDSFQDVFYYAAVKYQSMETTLNIAPQPIGYSAGLKAAKQLICRMKDLHQNRHDFVYVGLESFIAELVPERWYEITCIALEDPAHNIELETFSQAVRIPIEYVTKAQDQTPADYPLRWSGLAVTCGDLIRADRDIDRDWHTALHGISIHEIVAISSSVIAGEYRRALERLIATSGERVESVLESKVQV